MISSYVLSCIYTSRIIRNFTIAWLPLRTGSSILTYRLLQ